MASDRVERGSRLRTGDNAVEEQPKSCSGTLNSANWLPQWTPIDAIRELSQNMEDAIVSYNNIRPQDVKVEDKKQRNGDIIISYSARNDDRLLGFVKFDAKSGCLSFNNFNAPFKLSWLKTGVSSKVNDTNTAGCYGEGLKAAIGVLWRHGLRTRMTAMGFYWNFPQNNGDMKYVLTEVQGDKSFETVDRSFNQFVTSAKDDVAILIRPDKGCDPISAEQVREWFQVSFKIQSLQFKTPPHNAPEGDLVLQDDLPGKIYLKGLLVPYPVPVFTYNIASGEINRDRNFLSEKYTTAKISKIWKHALQTTPELVEKYVNLFFDNEDAVDIEGAKNYVDESMAKGIKMHLLSENLNGFLYPYNEAVATTSDPAIIVSDLKCKPVKIPIPLWEVLQKHKLVQTPKDRRQKLFSSSAVLQVPNTVFAESIKTLLEACLSLNNILSRVRIVVVQGGGTSTDLLLTSDNRLLIHQKWFSFEQAHRMSHCELAHLPGSHDHDLANGPFMCDHVVEDIIHGLVVEATRAHEISPTESKAFVNEARTRIRECPRAPALERIGSAGDMQVCWETLDNGMLLKHHGLHYSHVVVLHDDMKCHARKNQRVAREVHVDILPSGRFECGCPWQVIPYPECKATFSGLKAGTLYFAVVARVRNLPFWTQPTATVALSFFEDSGSPQGMPKGPTQQPILQDEAHEPMTSNFDVEMHSPAPSASPSEHVTSRALSIRSANTGYMPETGDPYPQNGGIEREHGTMVENFRNDRSRHGSAIPAPRTAHATAVSSERGSPVVSPQGHDTIVASPATPSTVKWRDVLPEEHAVGVLDEDVLSTIRPLGQEYFEEPTVESPAPAKCAGECGRSYVLQHDDDPYTLYIHKTPAPGSEQCVLLKDIHKQTVPDTIPPEIAGYLSLSVKQLLRDGVQDGGENDVVMEDGADSDRPRKRQRTC